LYYTLQLSRRLSGVTVAGNATIAFIEQTEMETNGDIVVLVTLLAPNGGSEELAGQLFSRLNTTAEELGISVGSVVRFGESFKSCDVFILITQLHVQMVAQQSKLWLGCHHQVCQTSF
jgi:hypothetical protein